MNTENIHSNVLNGMVSEYSMCDKGRTPRKKEGFLFSPSLLVTCSTLLCPKRDSFCLFFRGEMVQMKPSPMLFLSFFFFLSLIQDRKSFHQKNRCHLLWSFVVVLFYFIKKKFSPTEEAHLNIMKGQQESSHRGGSDSVGLKGGRPNKAMSCPPGSPPQGPSSCISDANGRRGCGGGGEGKGPGS